MISSKVRSIALGSAAALCSAMVFAQTPDAGAPKSPDKMFLHKASMGG
jgi:hypothetical protein